MELKPYQQEVISDLERFLTCLQETKDSRLAFESYWGRHPRMPLHPFPGTAVEPYKNNVPQAPHVCVKVPTAGGKTFIACNALKTIFNAFDHHHSRAVVWLVPSRTILEQTIGQLKNNSHPYRRKINSHFANRVEIYDKQALLQGSGFNASSVKELLSIFVLSFDSLRAKNKEERKVYQENSNLQSFSALLGQEEDISLMKVIRSLNPVVIVDESHNAESGLSVEMLRNLNPCFILDLTATPKKNSNIISFVDAMALKQENMVKLPVIVYNHHDKTEVINSALQMQRKLQLLADEEEKKGGRYIRPIVLFQAQPKNAEDTTTFEKVKEILIRSGIDEEEIRIKTANINELKDIDLSSRECKVRYIITVNALKEGWDCPFAYILASLADKSSTVDVAQILGRILRQPYVMEHENDMLNSSYVLTASSRFLDTLDNIVDALNQAGFSNKDFKAAELYLESVAEAREAALADAETEFDDDFDFEYDIERIARIAESKGDTPLVSEIEQRMREQIKDMKSMLLQQQQSEIKPLPPELQPLVKTYPIKEMLAELASQLAIPQFYIRKPSGQIFNEHEQLLSREDLLDGFLLSKADSNITFNGVSSSLYKIDLDVTGNEHTPTFVKIDGRDKDLFLSYFFQHTTKPSRVKNFSARIHALIGNMFPISEAEIKKYLHKLFEDFTDEQYRDFLEHEYSYVEKIRQKIRSLSDVYAEKQFDDYLHTDQIFIKPSYSFPKQIIPGHTSKPIAGSLYEREAEMNGFEEQVISEISGLSNIVFWTRNMERRQFKINGFINHYPDFIIHTRRGKTILLETKGDDRDNSDTEVKLKLGKAWEKTAGNNFKYFLVFNRQEMPGAYRLDDFLKLLKEL